MDKTYYFQVKLVDDMFSELYSVVSMTSFKDTDTFDRYVHSLSEDWCLGKGVHPNLYIKDKDGNFSLIKQLSQLKMLYKPSKLDTIFIKVEEKSIVVSIKLLHTTQSCATIPTLHLKAFGSTDLISLQKLILSIYHKNVTLYSFAMLPLESHKFEDLTVKIKDLGDDFPSDERPFLCVYEKEESKGCLLM